MANSDGSPEQFGSTWVRAQRARGRSEEIDKARRSGALAELLTGRDPDACPSCGGTGRRKESA